MEPLANDPMIDTIMDKDIIDIASTLIAKMEMAAYDEMRTSVFATRWARDLFAACACKMMGEPFNIDMWYISNYPGTLMDRRDIDPSLYRQPINSDWLSPLLQLEMQSNARKRVKGSFLRVLHNLMELEDLSQRKLADLCKKDRQYDCLGIAKRPLPGQLLISGTASAAAGTAAGTARVRPPAPGSVEDLLSNARS